MGYHYVDAQAEVRRWDTARKVAEVRDMVRTPSGGINHLQMAACESLCDQAEAPELLLGRLDALTGPAYVAFLHFYHQDTANACMHVADVRFSPLTFRLAEALEGQVNNTGEIEEVLAHRGQYAEDTGR